MTVDIFREVRERVSAQDAARHYGLAFDRRDWAVCPFHSDKHPSMSFKNGRFRCWACGASGDSIDFVGRFLSLDALGAVRRLNDDFRLGLPINRKQTPQERAEAARAAAKRRELSDTAEAFAAWRGAMLDKLNACFRLAHLTMKAIATSSDIDRLTDAQALAIREQARIECLADVLISGTTAEQMEVFRERRAINQLCEMILSSMPTKSGAA